MHTYTCQASSLRPQTLKPPAATISPLFLLYIPVKRQDADEWAGVLRYCCQRHCHARVTPLGSGDEGFYYFRPHSPCKQCMRP